MNTTPPPAASPDAAPPPRARRRSLGLVPRLLLGVLAVYAIVLLPPWSRLMAPADEGWTGTWGAGLAGPALPAETVVLRGQTLRLIVHTSIGGSRARIRLSNEYGATALRIASAHIALRQGGAAIAAASDRELRFDGKLELTIPAGKSVESDPVALALPALADLAVSLYLPDSVQAGTVQAAAYQMSYVSAPGNFAGAATLPVERRIPSWPLLAEVDVDTGGAQDAAALAVLGDSIASGAVTSMDANRRWPDLLAQRLQAAGAARIGIVNRGIGGNRLLRDPAVQPVFGIAALDRFGRDVLGTAGVRAVIVAVGINDLGHPGMADTPASELPSADDMVEGYRALIAKAHKRGIAIVGVTMTPVEGTVYPGYATPQKERIRYMLNEWMRSAARFDGVIDADLAVRDPDHPARLLPAYDSGDHLHPNDRGMQAIADAVPLAMLREAARGYRKPAN